MDDQQLHPVSAPTAVKIIEAATHLFMQRGYKAVSISDIIKAADVTKPTLYYYFADKEELFVQMGLTLMETMGTQLREAASGVSSAERLTVIAGVLLAERDGDMRLMRHEMFEHVGPANRELLSRAFYSSLFAPIHAVMVQGLAAGDLARYPAETLTAMFLGLSESFHEFGQQARLAQWAIGTVGPFANTSLNAQTMVDLFLHGVTPQPVL
ncbi:MAG: TetR/AcrR family transcriptional regulator [Oscillochloris sp.]|nr:TetR/AcrR family transcriptional regulator [Oscillochloris sp.]